jgi:signal transduction histidine kinase
MDDVRDPIGRKALEEILKSKTKSLDEARRQLEEKNRRLEAAYQDLKETQSRVIQQEKMASIGQLAAGIAHEINNPTGFVHPGKQELSYANINHNLDSTLNIVWNELKYKATVKKDYGGIPEVLCYPQQLNQVFMNILVNAAQAIEKQGEMRITTRPDNGHVEIKISDTGGGIPKENLSKIFDPFFTSKEVGKGTGLGLHVAYNIIEKHKGTIEVESKVGEGTTFTIKIPI